MQFDLFVILVSFMILLHACVLQRPPLGLMQPMVYLWRINTTIFTVPTIFPLPEFASGITFPVMAWLEIVGAVLLAIPLTRRFGGLCLFIATLCICLFAYPNVGVGDPLFVLVGLLFSIFPGNREHQRDTARDLFIGLLAGTYLCSALMKLNPAFVSGQTLRTDAAHIMKPHILKLYSEGHLYQLASLIGIAFEIGAATLFFVKGTRIGFLCSLIFHCLNAVQINWALSIEILPAALPFLFCWKRRNAGVYFITVFGCFALVYSVSLFLSGRFAISEENYELFLILAPLLIMMLVIALNVKSLLNFETVSIFPHYGLRSAALGLCLAVTFLSRWLTLPTPLGFTQFSGVDSIHAIDYILAVHSPDLNLYESVTKVFFGRWDIRQFYQDNDTVLFSFPSAAMREYAQNAFCRRDRSLLFITYEISGVGLPTPLMAPEQNQAARVALAAFAERKQAGFSACPH